MDSDIVVVDEVEKSDQVEPEATALPVEEKDATVSETVKSENGGGMNDDEDDDDDDDEEEMVQASKAEEPETEKSEEPEVTKAEEDATVKMVNEISESLTSALSTLAETVKALDAKIEGINKSVAGVASKVEEVEEKFGKRVDAVEKDTAFRKSADLGEILQEEPVIMEKSMWGGRFLTNADLF